MTGIDIIPEMTDSLSVYWHQPKREDIIFDRQGNALISNRVFEQLPEYSTSIPTGVYLGKMWKCYGGDFPDKPRTGFPTGSTGVWYLVWYGPDKEPDMVSINRRLIVLPNG